MTDIAEKIVGKTIKRIWWSEYVLRLETDQGDVDFIVDGDCCSTSYFHDFYGVKHLLENGPIVAFEDHDLGPDDIQSKIVGGNDYDQILVYGYRFTTDHPRFGLVTSVLSFRNSSNGYYGGSMNAYTHPCGDLPTDAEVLTDDKIG